MLTHTYISIPTHIRPSMARATGETGRVKYGGLAVALVGFVLTRFTVLDAVRGYDSLLRFLLGEGVVMVSGLGLVVFGVGLAVSTFERHYVNTVAKWCVLGTVAMMGVAGLAVLERVVYEMDAVPSALSSGFVTTALVAGAVGGTFVGLRSAANRRNRRRFERQADRTTVLNRILRHEVLNKTTVIEGYADLLAERSSIDVDEPVTAIRDGADHIGSAIDDVGVLVQSGPTERPTGGAVALSNLVERRLAAARKRHPGVTFELDGSEKSPRVAAGRQFELVLDHLLDNAARHNDADDPEVRVTVRATDATARVAVADNGPGLPADQRALVTEASLPEYDDPTAGFGLSVVALLADRHGWTVEADADEGGTTVALELHRASWDAPVGPGRGVALDALRNVTVAGLVAGVGMGLLLQAFTGAIPIIGALYGVETMAVGWITHLFHSVVFGVAFAAALSRPHLARIAGTPARTVLLGVGYGVLLWLFAAGVAMPIWLNAVGTPAPIPNLQPMSLLTHVVWGAILAATFLALPATRSSRE